ncbi:MAG TPA: ornithine cyclodeaminase family protein [Gemmatimonadaceae bacterium]|nr:ornithine cyclodeaminase family protein [Gemmatimonadaceae bacterium]
MLVLLDEDKIRSALGYETLIPTMSRALAAFSTGRVTQPVRTILGIPAHSAFYGVMPVADETMLGAKLVTVYPHHTPTHKAVIQLFDAKTGTPLALLDGRLITEMRTAAVSAVATQLLASPTAHTLAILGSGVQARAHMAALKLVRDFDQIRVWSRNPDNARRLAEEIGAKATSAEEAVRGADVVVTVTHASEPVLKGEWLDHDVHVNAVGAVGRSTRELDGVAMQRSTVIVDSRAAAEQEAGDILMAGATIYAELGELIANKVAAPPSEGRTVFKSLGLAVEDLAAARLVYEAFA